MMLGQLSGRKSLRDLVSNISVQGRRICHLGMKSTSRSTLVRVNGQQPYNLCRAKFYKLFARCRTFDPRHRFQFDGKIYLLDTTKIDLCLAVFPWASFRKTKGAIKLHFGLDAYGYLPVFMNMTNGKKHEVDWAKTLTLHPGACVVFDQGFTDYSWYQQLTKRKNTFVTRLKRKEIVFRLGNSKPTDSDTIQSDQKIKLKGV